MLPSQVRRRLRGVAASAVIAIALSVTASACVPAPQVTWKLGQTHGVVIETGGQRGSMNIYRSPRNLLMKAWNVGGMDFVMGGLWTYGKAPKFSLCAFSVCFDQTDVNSKIHGWIYGDPWDLKGALFDAQRNLNCLSLTIISHGVYNKNWTNKSVGCALGSIPNATRSASDPMADDGTELVTVSGQPEDPGDRPAGSHAPMPGPPEPVGAAPVVVP